MQLQVVYAEALDSPRLSQRKALNSTQGKGSSTVIGVKGAGGINMILALLEDLLGGLQVRDDWLQLGGTSLCRTFSSVRLAEAVMRARFPALLGAGVLCLEESPKASESLCPAEAC